MWFKIKIVVVRIIQTTTIFIFSTNILLIEKAHIL